MSRKKSAMERLTPRQRAVLTRLVDQDININGAETGREIATACWRFFTSYEQGQRTCRQLQARGLAEPLGYHGNAQTWQPTASGRALLLTE